MDADADAGMVDAAVEAGALLFSAIVAKENHQIEKLLVTDAPLWYQEPESGWTVLHVAAHNRDLPLMKKLLDKGAIWNAGSSFS